MKSFFRKKKGGGRGKGIFVTGSFFPITNSDFVYPGKISGDWTPGVINYFATDRQLIF